MEYLTIYLTHLVGSLSVPGAELLVPSALPVAGRAEAVPRALLQVSVV